MVNIPKITAMKISTAPFKSNGGADVFGTSGIIFDANKNAASPTGMFRRKTQC